METRPFAIRSSRLARTGAVVALAGLAAWLVACSPAAPAASPRAAAPAGTAPGQPAATAPPAPVKVGVTYSSKTPNQLPLWLGIERGFLAQHGIDAEVSFLSSTLSGQGLVANSVQFGLIGAEGIDINLEHGSPITHYIAGVTPKLVFKAIAQPEIQSFQDLRGKTVAATRKGSVTDFAWRKILELNGLELGRDVPILYPGSLDGAFSALIAGQIQATLVTPPLDLQATKQGIRLLADVEKMDIPYLMGGVIVRTDYASANPDVVERYLKAHLQGVATTLLDPATALDVLAKYFEVDDREMLQAAYDTFRPTFTRDQLMPEAAIVATLQESPRPDARGANPKDFYDNSFLERIKASGYIDSLYAGR